jgi:phosphatidylglycerol lysyltransferase
LEQGPAETITTSPAAIRRSIARLWHADRWMWTALLVACFAVFLWRNSSDIGHAVVVLRTADIWWLAAVFIAAALMHLDFTLVQSALLRTLGFRIPLPVAIRTYAERQTAATVIPFGSASSLVMMTRQFGAYGVTNSAAVLSFALYSLIGYLTFALVLAPVLVWMVIHGTASGVIEIAAALLLGLLIVALTFFVRLMRGGSQPGPLQRRVPERMTAFIEELRGHRIAPRSLLLPGLLALAADLLGPLCLYLSLRAAHVHPSVGVVAAGYVVGTLFVLVAPVFQGLGIVELSMTVVLQQFGVPVSAALGATLIYRLGEVWLPVIFGVAIHAARQRRLRGAPARIPALWTGLTGSLAVLSLVAPLHPHDLRSVRQVEFFKPDAATLWSITLAAGLLLLYLSYGLLRRQRLAWFGTALLSVVLVATHLKLERDRGIAVIALVNLALLLIYRRRFRVRNDPPSLRIGLITLGVSALFALAYGVIGFWLATPREFGREFDFSEAFGNTIDRYFAMSDQGIRPRTRRADWFLDSFSVVGVVTVTVSVIALARPVIRRQRTSVAERLEAQRLIEQFGDSSQDFFKYWPDKHLFFSEARDGVVAYGTSNAVALTLGDPVAGDAAAFRVLLDEFIDFCDRNGWHIAIHQATRLHLPAYREAGLIAMKIGGEAIVDLATFSVGGKKMKGSRSVLNRYEREGYRAAVYQPPLMDEVVTRLREVSDEWLTISGRRERGFTLGQYSDEYVRRSTVLTVESAEGRVEAFINLIPDGVPGEITFDMMRHRLDAPNGAMDFVLLKLIDYGRENGFHRLSLGMVPFADIGTGPEAPLRERALSLLTTRFDRYFSASTLYAYKDKFGPIWEPRYLVYSSDASLPRIGLAIARITEEVPRGEEQPVKRARWSIRP